jgi:hypothetical protein
VLSATAACPVFDRRSLRLHRLQPPLQLVFTLTQRTLELVSSQLWCRDNAQRVPLLCCIGPLSTLAFRLARAVNRRESNRSFELRAMAEVMKRCFGILAWRLWTGFERGSAAVKNDDGIYVHDDDSDGDNHDNHDFIVEDNDVDNNDDYGDGDEYVRAGVVVIDDDDDDDDANDDDDDANYADDDDDDESGSASQCTGSKRSRP